VTVEVAVNEADTVRIDPAINVSEGMSVALRVGVDPDCTPSMRAVAVRVGIEVALGGAMVSVGGSDVRLGVMVAETAFREIGLGLAVTPTVDVTEPITPVGLTASVDDARVTVKVGARVGAAVDGGKDAVGVIVAGVRLSVRTAANTNANANMLAAIIATATSSVRMLRMVIYSFLSARSQWKGQLRFDSGGL
jgi:hypothetical protein